MRKFLMGLALIGAAAGFAAADTIVDQPYDGTSGGRVAQDFGDFPSFSSFEFDDFSTSDDYYVTLLTVPGSEAGDRDENTDVVGEIWTDLPDRGGSLVMSGLGTEGDDGSLSIDFSAQLLNAGSYWITAYVARDFTSDNDSDGASGGQWFWLATTPVNGSQEQFYNPGGGFGAGTSSIDGEIIFDTPADQAFKLEGRLVPEPSALALLALGALSMIRRR